MLAGVAAGRRQDFGRQQVEDEAVLVGRPDRAVLAQEGSPGAFFAAKAERAIQQPIHELLEAHRHLAQLAPQVGCHAVDHRAGYQGLADRHIFAPAGAVLEQVPDGGRQVMVGVHQPHAAGDDAVPVVVGVIAKGDVKLVFELDQAGHGVGRGAVHADLAIMIQGHEGRRSGRHAG